jgi:hypothetical protein
MKIYFNKAVIHVLYLVNFQENFIQREIPVSSAGFKKVTAADQHEFDLLYSKKVKLILDGKAKGRLHKVIEKECKRKA